MEIDGCTFELPGSMWAESWDFINAVYLLIVLRSIALCMNVFEYHTNTISRSCYYHTGTVNVGMCPLSVTRTIAQMTKGTYSP
eukprot:SAG25_NODE_674_length_5997_cov_8.203084_4_plen_83_part_00